MKINYWLQIGTAGKEDPNWRDIPGAENSTLDRAILLRNDAIASNAGYMANPAYPSHYKSLWTTCIYRVVKRTTVDEPVE